MTRRRADEGVPLPHQPGSDQPGPQIVTMLPDDIILNTRRAFSTSATIGDRLLGSRRARRPLHRAGQQRRRASQLKDGRLRAADAARARAVVHALRHRAWPRSSRRRARAELRGAVRRAERVRQHQLQPGRQPRHRRDDLPGRRRPTRTSTTRSIRAAGSARSPGASIGRGVRRGSSIASRPPT